jgi:rsbT co-antagonist protein RsbR
MSDASQEQPLEQRLARLIQFLTPTVYGFGILFGLAGFLFQDWSTIIAAGFVIVHATCILAAGMVLRRGKRDLAAYFVGYGAFISTLGMSAAMPALAPGLAVIPFLIAAVLLQFAPPRDMSVYLAVCALAAVISMLLGSFMPQMSVLPAGWLQILRISTFIAIVMVALWMLGQFSGSLQAALARVQESNEILTKQQKELAETNQMVTTQLEEERKLLALVMTLEIPVVPVADQILLAPLVGQLDARRVDVIRQRLLTAASSQTRAIILDLSGLPPLNREMVHDLIQIAQALRLLGVSILLCGISPDMALNISRLEIPLKGIQIAGTVQEAIAHATAMQQQRALSF